MISTPKSIRPLIRLRNPGRWLALTVLLIGLIAVITVIALPLWWGHRFYDQEIGNQEDKLQRYRRLAAQIPDLRHQLEEAKKHDPAIFFLKAKTASLGGSELQELIGAKIQAVGARMNTSQIGNPKEVGNFRQIILTAQVQAKLATLQKLLYELENARPYVYLDGVRIQSTYYRNYVPVPGQEQDLNVSLDLSAYMLKELKS